MIEHLTDDQLVAVSEYRERYWRQAINTEPADRPRAEAAARRLAEIAGVVVRDVHWVTSPDDGNSLNASLLNSLNVSLWNSLSASLWNSLNASLRNSLRNSLNASLWDSLADSLRNSFADSLWDSLMDSLWSSLRNSLMDSLRDSSWLCYYSYAVSVLDVECSIEHRELLMLHNEIAASCFAFWIVPGAVILCERPKEVEIVDEKLVGITWRDD